ncbi:MAG: hypothetical protein JW731_10220 [Bacteroidales bacterium]|nr:hypothetical protein [Bacteroidales bacterium]
MNIKLLRIVAVIAGCSFPATRNSSIDTSRLMIAYNVLVDEIADDYEVFVMNLDGSGKRNISNSPGVDWVYYANKDKIYFVSDRDTAHRHYFLWEMNADGFNKRRVSDLRLEDCFFSSRNNGLEFIIKPHRFIDSAFYIIDLNGRLIRKVDPGLPYFYDVSFSPDGESIVFRGANKKSKKEEGFSDELYVMNIETGLKKRITQYPADDTTAEWWAYHAGPPVWEPNRNIISYASKRKGVYSLFSVYPNGSDSKQITPDGFDAVYHSWSPDGEFLVTDGTGTIGENYDIYLMQANGSGIERLTSDTIYEQGPVFVYANSTQ